MLTPYIVWDLAKNFYDNDIISVQVGTYENTSFISGNLGILVKMYERESYSVTIQTIMLLVIREY